jgi:ApeA N-terminal domain 1
MTQKSWRGHWWLPGTATIVAGELHKLEGGHLRLDLAGRLHAEGDDEFMVLGETTDGPFTLLKCSTGRASWGGIDVQDINAGQYLRGLHLASPDEARFTSTTVRIEYLLGFLGGRSTFELTTQDEDGLWTGEQTGSTRPIDDLTLTCGDFDFTFALVVDQFNYEHHARANELHLAAKEWCELTVSSKTPLPYDGFQRQVKAIMDLLTLVAHAPAGVLEERLQYKTSDERLLQLGVEVQAAELFGRQVHQPATTEEETARGEYLFTLDDVDLAEMLPKWLETHEQAWLACAMLFGLRYIREGYTPSRLMTSVTVAEALHRELYPDETALPPEKFDNMMERILSVCSGHDADSKAQRKYLRDNLKNRLSCKDRLLRLADIPDHDAVAHLISDVPRWAKLVRDARDGVAHASRERLTPEGAGSGYYALEVNIMLVSLVLMARIGVPSEIQRRAVRSRYLWYIVEQFNRSLASA